MQVAVVISAAFPKIIAKVDPDGSANLSMPKLVILWADKIFTSEISVEFSQYV